MLLTINSVGLLLDLFTPEAPERGVTEVAQELGVSKSKAHTLLASLTEVGILRRIPGGRYRLGWRLLTLNRVLQDTSDFRRQARPIMENVSRRLGETVHLGTIYDDQVVYLERAQADRAARAASPAVGSVHPAHCTAIGKILLASMSRAELHGLVMRRGLAAVTPRTVTDPAKLTAELEEAARRGSAVDHGEATAGVSSVAAPIVMPGPNVVAAISISVESERFRRHEAALRQAVVTVAARISRAAAETDADAADPRSEELVAA